MVRVEVCFDDLCQNLYQVYGNLFRTLQMREEF